jgi:hypothetical protein
VLNHLKGLRSVIARISFVPYDLAISATGYVSKYVTKDFGDWELTGNFVPIAERQPRLY